MDSLPSRLFISLVLLALIAVYRAAQKAADEANEARMLKLSNNDEKVSKIIEWLCDNKSRIHATTQLINLLLITAMSAFVFGFFHFTIEGKPLLSSTLSVLLADVLVLVFGIYTPGIFAKHNAEKHALSSYALLRVSVAILTPIVYILTSVSNILLRLLGVNPAKEDEVTEEEILMMVDIGSSSGAIDPEEKEMINNIFEFDDTPAKDIMTHRTDVEFLWIEDSIDEWDKVMLETNHSIYPVCDESVDNIIGIIASKDFYRMLRTDVRAVSSIMKTPFFVPESIKADELFRQMQKNKTHFAVVLDEYGGLGGIITISDLLEEIVGTLSSDTDEEDDDIIQLDENTWKIPGSCDIDTVAETLGIELPVEEYNTFAGMILGELGTIPDDGTTPSIEAYNLSIKVLKIEDHRIEAAKVAKIIPETENLSDE
ncbi:MAG: HlyC/CorC family transporter [Clostridia bacterium]|nr:HlyC/CorC family transporter [Clostridia bacterium]